MRTISTLTVQTALEEVDDVFLVVGEAVGVEAFADGWISGFALFVLVEDPFEWRSGCRDRAANARRVRRGHSFS